MSSTASPSDAPLRPEHELSSEVDRIVQSGTFHGSEILRHLLRYLAARSLAPEPVKVREIAIEVFGRSDDFDSQTDSIVRVHAGRLRSKLAEYYMGDGGEDPIIVSIPKGGYALTWHNRQPLAGVPTEMPVPALMPPTRSDDAFTAPQFRRLRRLALAGACALAITVIGWMAVARLIRQRERSQDSAAVRSFWQPFLSGEQPPLLVFSNLELVGSLDTGLREYDPRTDQSQPVIRTYTTTGEVMGVFEISNLLTSFHRSVRAKHGFLLTWDEAKDSDLVFVGGPLAETPVREVPTFTEFQFRNRRDGIPGQSGAVVNVRPQSGEEPVYYGPSTRPFDFDYAVIALRTSMSPKHWILTLAGITEYGTEAAADFVTKEDSLSELLTRLGVGSGRIVPPFEALLYTKITGGVPIEHRLVLVHKSK